MTAQTEGGGSLSADQLAEFGHWSGGYMVTCRSCNEAVWNVGKRAWRCAPCAEAAFLANELYEAVERASALDTFVDAVSAIDGEDVLIGGYIFRKSALIYVAQAIETQRAKTEGLGPKDESVVGIADAPDPHPERERKISREGAEDEGCGAGEVKRG